MCFDLDLVCWYNIYSYVLGTIGRWQSDWLWIRHAHPSHVRAAPEK